ncbi:MAG: hypothetical protein H6767_03665 [Candidatus Peribacteria bacterium]|nr:MAG: hypothetical protein H6767_03665 [Candidatus Peribacteria bacterium]
MAVGENDDTIVFLRKIIPGSMKKSYGLEVAKLAGISKTVITEARKMLKTLELEHNKGTQLSIDVLEKCTPVQETPDPSEVETILVQIDPNSMTPMEALNLLQELKDKI